MGRLRLRTAWRHGDSISSNRSHTWSTEDSSALVSVRGTARASNCGHDHWKRRHTTASWASRTPATTTVVAAIAIATIATTNENNSTDTATVATAATTAVATITAVTTATTTATTAATAARDDGHLCRRLCLRPHLLLHTLCKVLQNRLVADATQAIAGAALPFFLCAWLRFESLPLVGEALFLGLDLLHSAFSRRSHGSDRLGRSQECCRVRTASRTTARCTSTTSTTTTTTTTTHTATDASCSSKCHR
jgi:hypothetical protein